MGASKRRLVPLALAGRSRRVGAVDAASAQQTETRPAGYQCDRHPPGRRRQARRRGVAPGTGTDAGTEAPADTAGVSGIVTGTIITGASSTVITAQDIERSPGHDLAGRAGARARHPGDATCSAGQRRAVDRGHARLRRRRAPPTRSSWSTAGGSTTSIWPGVDFSAIPKNSIERIEITRGNSGAVLYGDGAVGGVINIVTKTGVDLPPSARVQAGFGSFNYLRRQCLRQRLVRSAGQFALRCTPTASAPTAIARTTSCARRMRSAISAGTTGRDTGAYLNLSADDQHLGLPGGRRVTPTINELVTNRRGAATPFDFGDKKGLNAHARRHPHAVAGHRADRRRRRAPQETGSRLLQRRLRRLRSGFKAEPDRAVADAAAVEPAHDSAACRAS